MSHFIAGYFLLGAVWAAYSGWRYFRDGFTKKFNLDFLMVVVGDWLF